MMVVVMMVVGVGDDEHTGEGGLSYHFLPHPMHDHRVVSVFFSNIMVLCKISIENRRIS